MKYTLAVVYVYGPAPHPYTLWEEVRVSSTRVLKYLKLAENLKRIFNKTGQAQEEFGNWVIVSLYDCDDNLLIETDDPNEIRNYLKESGQHE